MKHLLRITALAALLGTALPASGHVVFADMEVEPGKAHIAQFRIPHGCDGSPTHTVTIEMPQGVTRVAPRNKSGWDVSITMRELETPFMLHGFEVNETVDHISWAGGSVPDFSYEQFEFRMVTPDTPNARLDFKVKQVCDTGEIYWNEIAEPDQDPFALKAPAPFIMLKATP